jgi:ATP-dependent helicase/nuclease subunit A
VIRPPDQEARTTAWQCFDKNIAVTAGAGTGKTRVLVDRHLAWILGEAWTRPEWNNAASVATSIVAITFTEKAAGEMADRIARSLRRIAGHEDAGLDEREGPYVDDLGLAIAAQWALTTDQVRARAQELVQQVHRLEVSTIHAFAANVLRRYPLAAQIRPDFQIDADRSQRRSLLTKRLIETTKDGLRGPRSADVVRILSTVGMDDLRALMEGWLDCDFDGVVGSPPDWVPVAEQCRSLAHILSDIEDNVGTRSQPKLLRLRDALQHVAALLDEHGDAFMADPRAWLEMTAGDAFRSLQKDKLSEYPAPTIATKMGPAIDEFRAGALAVSAFVDEVVRADPALIDRIVAIYSPMVTETRRALRGAGILSYDDLLRLTRYVLTDHVPIATAIAEAHGQILVDEFQDTSPTQCAILQAVRRVAKRPFLFVVGDPKQSIYSFRGADLAAYEEFVEGLDLQLKLTANFRSQAHLVTTLNEGFGRLFVETSHLQPAPQALSATVDPIADQDAVCLWDVQDGTDKRPKAEQVRIIEAKAIVDAIRTIDASDAANGPRWSRFAVISRVQTAAARIVDALEEAGIPCAVSGDKEFYRRQEVLDMANLLRVVRDPLDAVAWIGVLRSPLGAIPDRLLVDLAHSGFFRTIELHASVRTAQEKLGDGDADRAHLERLLGLIDVLDSLRESLATEPLHRWSERIHEQLPLWELYGTQYLGERKTANLQRVLRRFIQTALSGAMPLGEWLAEEAEKLVGAREETESALADETTDAVRILSIHAAKGLQFDHVFVPRLDWATNERKADASGLHRHNDQWIVQVAGNHSWGLTAWSNRRSQIEEAETIRLLYVACTRARRSVILSGAKTSTASRSMLPLVDRAFSMEHEPTAHRSASTIHPSADADTARRPPSETTPQEKALASKTPSWWRRRHEQCQATLERRLIASASTASALYDNTSSPHVEGGQRSAALALGDEVHQWLERWDGHALDLTGASPEAAKILEPFVTSPLAQRVRDAKQVFREIPFVGVGPDGNTVAGSMDLLMERSDGWTVVDYKTNRVRDQEDAEHLSEHYEGQASLYSHAVCQALGLDSVRFELWFVRGPYVVSMP